MISNVEKVLKKSHEDAIKERDKEIAKMMLEDNKNIEEIMKYTSLTKEEIEELK